MHLALFVVFVLILEAETRPKLDYQTRVDLARAHYESVVTRVSCGVPRPRVFRMKDPSYKLVPPATVLYRCGSSTGCCDNPLHECVAKTKEKVKLYFFVVSKGGKVRKTKRQRVKKFVFTNHTQCHCFDQRYIPR